MPGDTTAPAPAATVLIPARNAAATLEACLRSVARQTARDWECLVIDDGATDETAAIVRARAASDPRFRVEAARGRGLVAALAEGLAHARGRNVVRLDADDWMLRDRIEAQTALLDRFEIVGCGVRRFPRAALGPGMRAYEAWLNALRDPGAIARDAFVECPVAHPAIAARTATLRRLGYRDAGWPEDYDLVLRALEAGIGIGTVPRRLVAWRISPDGASATDPRYGIDRFERCKAHYLCRGLLNGHDRFDLWGYGGTGRAIARALDRLGRRPRRIVDVHPGRIGGTAANAPVVAPDAVAPPDGTPMLVSVAGSEPRTRIRTFLHDLGYRDGADFVCVA